MIWGLPPEYGQLIRGNGFIENSVFMKPTIVNCSMARCEASCPILFFRSWDLIWHVLAQFLCTLSQLLSVYMCTCPAGSRHSSLVAIHCFCILHSFCPFCNEISEPWKEGLWCVRVCTHTYTHGITLHLGLDIFQWLILCLFSVGQLWVSMLIIIYYSCESLCQ